MKPEQVQDDAWEAAVRKEHGEAAVAWLKSTPEGKVREILIEADTFKKKWRERDVQPKT